MSLIIQQCEGEKREREVEGIVRAGSGLIGTADQSSKKRMSFRKPQNETIPGGP